jgi:hypothetical protein
MKYKPTQEELISYLYGELSAEEMDKVDAYLREHPEARKELEALQDTRMRMSEYEEEDMPEPMAFLTPSKNEEWLYWRKYVAIAATLLLIITFGTLSGFKVISTEQGMHIGFGEANIGLTEDQVADLIYQDRVNLLDYVNASLEARNDSIDARFSTLQASLTNEDLVRQTFEAEKEAFLQEVSILTDKLGDDYRGILREIVVNFSNNIETQRIEDLRNIQAAFDAFENATVNRQLDVEDALFNLSEKVNTIAASLSNRN